MKARALLRATRSVAPLICLLVVPAAALADPAVSHLSDDPVSCTGYLEIHGTGFGSTGGLTVNGETAPVASWSNDEIVGYVPVGAASGPASLQVTTGGGASAPFPFEIAPCDPVSDRLLWRLRFDVPYHHARPVVGPDGTVYVLDLRNRLYAVDPGGRVRWIVDGALPADASTGEPIFGNTSVDVDAEGNLYSAHKWYVSSLYPDGTPRWRFDIESARRSYIVYDTKVGPDGNIYIAASHTPSADALGVYSLTPDGDLRWNVAHPYDRTTRKQIDLVFGPGPEGPQLYFSANQNSYALTLQDGDVVFDNLPQVTGFAAVSEVDDTVHSSNYAYLPDGTIDWQSPIFLNGAMSMDSQGIHYATTSMTTPRIVALRTDGSVKYERNLNLPSGTSPDTTTVSADDALLFVHDVYQRLLVLDRKNGVEQWRIELGQEEGRPQYWRRRPAFKDDASVAYYLSAVNAGGTIRDRAFLNAITPGANSFAPGRPVVLRALSLSGTSGSPTLHLTDPNSPFDVTGYHVYRSSDPNTPPASWPRIGSNVVDEDPATAGIQWTDGSGDTSPSGCWFYQVTAYNAALSAEGPF